MFFLYIAVSESAVIGALIQEEGIQKPVYYVSHSMNKPQTRYQRLIKLVLVLHHLEEAQALLSKLPNHSPHRASPKKSYREPRSDEEDIEMDIETETLWNQIRAEDNNQRTGLGELYCRPHLGGHRAV